MQNKWKILLFLLAIWFVAIVIFGDGRNYCNDGTITLSKGRGTCSWHQGKGTQPELKVANFIFLGAIGVWVYLSFFRESGRPLQRRFTTQKPIQTKSDEQPVTRVFRPISRPPALVSTASWPADSLVPPFCPKCEELMVLRLARKGRNRGKNFWGCRKFPRCNGVINCLDSPVALETTKPKVENNS